MKSFYSRLLGAFASFALLAGPLHAADRTVAVLLALTGDGAFYGVPAAAGMKLAVEELLTVALKDRVMVSVPEPDWVGLPLPLLD